MVKIAITIKKSYFQEIKKTKNQKKKIKKYDRILKIL